MTRHRFDPGRDAPAGALDPERIDELLRQSERERESRRADVFVEELSAEQVNLGHHGKGDPKRRREIRHAKAKAGTLSPRELKWRLAHPEKVIGSPAWWAAQDARLDVQTIEPTPDG